MAGKDSQYQPSSILFRHKDFTQHISAVLGATDFHANYDNAFTRAKLIMKFLPELIYAIEHKVCKVPDEFFEREEIEIQNGAITEKVYKPSKMDVLKEFADRLDKIWNGDCYKAMKDGEHFFLYRKPEPNEFDEFVKMPRMKNLVPVGELKDDTLWIQVKEPLPVKYAFNRTNWATLVQEGGFSIKTKEGTVAKLEKDDMESLTKFSYVYSRDVFYNIIDDLEFFFNKNWTPISVICQEILDYSGMIVLSEESDGDDSLMADMVLD